ncbi:hypothetical protein GALMADRAFT_284753 [Galerina marginata CBS 339.88]|uniref:ABC transporter domain-containing protein n=1 Tax=Galerina marginata (strain CBS 339.88) TaxID=685588 RepID=A0A067TNG9_GALM3|nr:hypothetical protein GALMADRAFT_284753 [Galerina marginata CBS 339.88]
MSGWRGYTRINTMSVKHTILGIWHLYEEKDTEAPVSDSYAVVRQSLPYLWRMATDIASIRECRPLLAAFLLVVALRAVVPAIALSYSGQLLAIVQSAVEHRAIDTDLLLAVLVGSFLSSSAKRLLNSAHNQISRPLQRRIKLFYSVHIFSAFTRLDQPTFDDPAVQRQLERAFPPYEHTAIAFAAISNILNILATAVQLITQVAVLLRLLTNQRDGLLLALVCFPNAFFSRPWSHKVHAKNSLWVATVKDEDYIRMEGLKRMVSDPAHRQEIVAAGIASYLLQQYRLAVSRVSTRAAHFYQAIIDDSTAHHANLLHVLLPELLYGLPELAFAFRAIQQPASIPLSLASLHLIRQTTQSFTQTAYAFVDETDSITNVFSQVIHLYEVAKIPNRVKVHLPEKENLDQDDPTLGVPFPENDQTLHLGISVEFRDVSFKYPGSDAYALHHTSFKIDRGQLCVIVGNNGSGKSTILKLIARLYDPTDGLILIDGIDIKTLRLADLRRAISVLFQDYTLFPLSIRDNIGLGDPTHASSLSKIHEAAQLGGAAPFIERLPEQYDTYLERPVADHYSSPAEGSVGASGRVVDYTRVREAAGIVSANGNGEGGTGGGVGNRGVSGGQAQRIALSRTFMRSVVSDELVGLLLFDEPSASLDPTAEHDLFERLRKLRGNKTMIFSSHRFGNLTRHADLILYMNDAVVLEEGTHDELLRRDGEYARIWMLQARAFL